MLQICLPYIFGNEATDGTYRSEYILIPGFFYGLIQGTKSTAKTWKVVTIVSWMGKKNASQGIFIPRKCILDSKLFQWTLNKRSAKPEISNGFHHVLRLMEEILH